MFESRIPLPEAVFILVAVCAVGLAIGLIIGRMMSGPGYTPSYQH